MNDYICQSCGMPMKAAQDFGTNADQTQNTDYCSHCFQNGAFTNNFTMDEMIDLNLKYLNAFNKDSGHKFTAEEARAEMKNYFPTLKRWGKS